MIGLYLWPLLLPVAAFSGFWMGRKPENSKSTSVNIPKEYYMGLNFLLNEQPDRAVDVFLKLVEIDSETVETHLALGSLFRKRGEVDRAIRIHQNLIARPQLTSEQRLSALIALGRDYMSAGVLDRAERIFNEVVGLGGEYGESGLRYLLEIYQQEKAWQKAIKTAEQLRVFAGGELNSSIAHFYCELAEEALKLNDWSAAQRYLKRALNFDQNAVRSTILLGRLEFQKGAYNHAIRYFQKGIKQNPDFMSDIIPELRDAYSALGLESAFYDYLLEIIREYPDPKLIITYASNLEHTSGVNHAKQYLIQQLKNNPSISGIHQLTEWLCKAASNSSDIYDIKEVIEKLLDNKNTYKCTNCGFPGKKLHWQCPGCRKWGVVRPFSA